MFNANFHEELHDLHFITYLARSFLTKGAGANHKKEKISTLTSCHLYSQLVHVIKIQNSQFHEELQDIDFITFPALCEQTKEARACYRKKPI